ncbi:trypsin-1-like [Daktulosphaira vitifoliae]|uniref:trypsin-1-like n=1 Tax=Daktulosphaira vitifoliae TaxID=58002 RepID=UPI0021A98EEC|nr:trypsin-1-like [Daktulosphaira vitifoliae]
MWQILCIVLVSLLDMSVQRVPVMLPLSAEGKPGEMSQQSFSDYLSWWQNLIGIGTPTEDVTPEVPVTPIDQSTCPACTCGAIGKKNRIVGGVPTYKHQYPWMVMLTYKGKFYCGGTLINHKYVLTAAHCVHGFDGKNIGARILEHDRSITDEAQHIDFKVKKVIKHKGYSPSSYNNDIALLRLDTEGIELGQTTGINPVCLPVEGKSFAGYEGIISGWGAKKQGGSSSQILHEVYVPIMSNEDCRKTDYDAKRITNNMMCAGYPEGAKDSCQGDSGGPMHIANNSALHVVGVVSWGEGCALAKKPGVYSRVNRYLNWIHNNTLDACPCTNIYVPSAE